MALHNDLGRQGEEESVNYLLANGYEILERNWRFSRAEIDIIARKNEVLIFIEVKTRSSKKWGNPEDFINKRKIKLYMDAAYSYMDKIEHDWEIRFDVISILIPMNGNMELEHFKDAFVP